MISSIQSDIVIWPWWRKILFRFFFIYLALQIAPWTWLDEIPGLTYLTKYYYQLMDWAVEIANAKLFHVKSVLVPLNGSGDTSYGWAQTWLLLCVAFAGCVAWSLLNKKQKNYQHLNYWLCIFIRYFIALTAFVYGFAKLFILQMPFPTPSLLATTLGDFLPMRLSWVFIGYSTPYQMFAGCMEVTAGILLLYRRTTTLGVIFATAVFFNVLMLNLSYDIPVKIFSINLLLLCFYLLANEYNRIICFFILNKPAAVCSIYQIKYSKKWMRITRIIVKIAFVIIAVCMPFYNDWNFYRQVNNAEEIKPIKTGIYDVAIYAINRDTIAGLITDTLRWQDVIFEKGGRGSIKTSDASFMLRYKRGYFSFSTDTVQHTISFKKRQTDSAMSQTVFLIMKYQFPDVNTIQLWGKQRNDSLYVLLKKSNRHFQLAEKQFHWLSEYNR
jgi:hypothetical protein